MSQREVTIVDAPCHYRSDEASAWASGYNTAIERTQALHKAALDLYMAGHWITSRQSTTVQFEMWKALRDALDLPLGTATAAGLGPTKLPVLQQVRNACERVIEQSGGISHGIDWHALLKSLGAASPQPPGRARFKVGDRVQFTDRLNQTYVATVKIIEDEPRYAVTVLGGSHYVKNEGELQPYSGATKCDAP